MAEGPEDVRPSSSARAPAEHYLKTELDELVRRDPTIFEFLEAGSLDGLWYWDITDPQQEWLSPRFKEVFGYGDDEIPDTSEWWKANIHPDDLPLVMDNFEKHWADESHPYDQVVRYRHKDGSTVWIRCRGMAIRAEDGTPLRMLGAHTDVTELKRKELQLEQANRALEEFAVSLAHDLKNPLTTMRGFAELLPQVLAGVPAEAKELLDRLIANAERSVTMIDDLLEYARYARPSKERGPVPLTEIVDWARHMVHDELKSTDASFTCASLPVVHGNATGLRQVFLNLLSNSLKYADPARAPVITITSVPGPTQGMTTIRIADNGRGIDADAREHVFQLGWRAGHAGVEGLGIGLAVCKVIIGNLGGRIEAGDGPDGMGATITVVLPESRGSGEHAA